MMYALYALAVLAAFGVASGLLSKLARVTPPDEVASTRTPPRRV
jgi:hypothetical protein